MTLEELNKTDVFARTNGIQLTADGVAEMIVSPQHLNGANVCQGGAIFTLADLSQASLTAGQALTTAAEMHFIHSAKEGDRLVATSEYLHDGKIPLIRTRVTTIDGHLIAEMTGTLFRINKKE